jgi:GST-like protein
MSEQNYQPPKVWEWKQNSGGAFANINRPVSGATHERVLPVGPIRSSYTHWARPTARR